MPQRVSRGGSSSAVSSSSSCIVTSVDMVPPWGRSPPGPGSPGDLPARHPYGAGPRTWCTLSVERSVRSPPYTTYLWSVNAGEPRLISGNHEGSPEEGGLKLVAMTSQATGDEQDPPAEQPRPAAPLEPALNPLQRLIQQRLRERGWSYREVARRGGLPHSTVHTLAATRNLARPPRPATIDALAKGLEVPVSVVRAAAAESTGLHYYDEPTA